MTQKKLVAMMEILHENDKEGYDDLWKAMVLLRNLDLVDESITRAMVKKDQELFERENA